MNTKNTAIGLLSVIFYITHATYWIIHNVPDNLLWICHLSAVLVGIGWILQKSLINAIGTLWLVLGNIMWIIYLVTTHDFEPTSVLTHVGGLVIGIWGIKKMGIPKYAWLWAVVLIFIMQIITRFTTSEAENVNLAFNVQKGWEQIFPSYFWYEIMLLADAIISFLLAQLAFKKIFKIKYAHTTKLV